MINIEEKLQKGMRKIFGGGCKFWQEIKRTHWKHDIHRFWVLGQGHLWAITLPTILPLYSQLYLVYSNPWPSSGPDCASLGRVHQPPDWSPLSIWPPSNPCTPQLMATPDA